MTAIKLMQAMLANKQPLSVLAAPVKIYPQLLVNVRVSDKEAVLNNAVVKGSVREAEAALGDNGRVLCARVERSLLFASWRRHRQRKNAARLLTA